MLLRSLVTNVVLTKFVLTTVFAAVLSAFPIVSLAQEPVAPIAPETSASEPVTLVWKWEAGQTQKFVMAIDVSTKVDTAGKLQLSSNKTAAYGEWKVRSMEERDAIIDQTLSRMTLTLKTPELGEIVYDSESKQKPVGLLATIHESFAKAREGSETFLRFTPTGETQVGIASEGKEQETAGPKADSTMNSIPASLLVLPTTPVKPGDTWTHKVDDIPLGNGIASSMTTTYTLESVSGTPAIAVIKSQTMLQSKKDPATSAPVVIEETITGEHRFDIAKGRALSATRTSKLTTELKYRVTTIRTIVESTVTLTLVGE